MIAALIFIILIIVFLAFFVGKNLSNACTFWFFKTYTELPVTIIVFIAFAAGIVFALLCFLIGKIIRSSHESDIADAKNAAEKQRKKEEKLAKKLNKHKKAAQASGTEQNLPETTTEIKSSQNSTDKESKLETKENRIHG